jgi:outer membrane protein OmpA-like peptidoglycan-associated protein
MRSYRFLIFASFFIHLFGISLAQVGDSSRFVVKDLSINSKQSDFSPFLFGKKLYFSSGRENAFGVKYFNVETEQDLIDMFYAEKIDSINFKKPLPFSDINTKYNDGPICISKDGTELFITRNDVKRTKGKSKKPLSIFLSKKINNKWSKPEMLSFCNSNYSYCHPALLNDGKTLIFSSDVTGGYGGMDLYYSTFEEGTWTIPRNLGSKVNGADNEVFPFVSVNNTLYFSTNRKNGFGGLDIYSFNIKDSANNVIQILDLPINSTYDDFGVWVDSTENTGYFSSNRDTSNKDDIFYFKNKYPDFDNCTPQKKPTYCYTFFEESTLQTKDTLGMIYEWDFGDGSKKRGLKAKHCFRNYGNYSVQLNIIDKASGTLFSNEVSYDFTVEPSTKFYIDCADTLMTGKLFSIDVKKISIPHHTIKEAYWFFGDNKFTNGISVQHIYHADGKYNIKLGLVTKNDSTGAIEKLCTQKEVLVKDSLWLTQHHPIDPPKKSIVFDVNKTTINKSYYTYLDSLSRALINNSKLELIILATYAPTIGKDADNYKLAEKRADAIKAYFIKRGTNEERLETIVFKENNTLQAEPKKNVVPSNRRVEILVVKNNK